MRAATRRTSGACWGWPDARTPRRRPRGSWRSKRRSPRSHWAAERSDATRWPTTTRRTATELIAFAPGLDWKAMLDADGVGTWDRFNVNTPTALQGIAKLVEEPAARRLEGLPDLPPPDRATRRTCRRRSTTRISRSSARRWSAARSSASAGSAASTWSSGALGEAVGADLREEALPAGVEGEGERSSSTNLRAAYRSRIEKLRLDERRRRGKAREKLAAFRLKIGYPDKWRDYSALEIKSGDSSATRARASVSSGAAELAQARQARRQGRVGHDAADGQRLLQPGLERDRVPGGDPAAAVLRSERGRRRQLRRASAASSVTKWATASTTRAPSRRERHAATTGGPKDDDDAFKKRAAGAGRAVLRRYEPLPGPEGQRRAHARARTSATSAALASRYAGLPAVARTARRRAGARRHHRRPALLPGWAQVVALEDPRRGVARAGAVGSALAALLPLNGIVRNMDAWYTAFDVQPGDKLYLAPEQRVKIWQ